VRLYVLSYIRILLIVALITANLCIIALLYLRCSPLLKPPLLHDRIAAPLCLLDSRKPFLHATQDSVFILLHWLDGVLVIGQDVSHAVHGPLARQHCCSRTPRLPQYFFMEKLFVNLKDEK